MRVFRASFVGALVALVTSVGLVATTSPAWAAADDECGQSFICLNQRWDPQRYVQVLEGYNAVAAWLNGLGRPAGMDGPCDWYEGTPLEGRPCEYVEAYLPYAPGGGAQVKGIGTAAEVRSGTAMKGFLCSSGTACQKVLGGLGLLSGTGGAEDVMPDGQDPKTGALAAFGPGTYYPATVISRGPYADLKYVVSGVDVGDPVRARNPIKMTDTDGVCPISTNATATTNVTVTWRGSVVNKSTGQWLHNGGEVMWTVHGGVPEEGTCIDPSGLGSHPASDWELRSFDIVADKPGSLNELTSGFSWGQRYFPEGSSNRATVRCQRVDGTDHDVVGESTLIEFHRVVTPSCPAGERPLWSQLDVVLPDGSVVPQSIENLRPSWDPTTLPADRSPFPQCADGTCVWIIKVGNTWCAKGVQGCTDWAERPEEAKCFMGPYELPLTRCGWLERIYETGPSPIPATQPNTDGDPSTTEGPSRTTTPNPDASPAPGPTRVPQPNPSTNPTGSPNPTPTSSTPSQPQPCTAGQACQTPPDPAKDAKCFPTGWTALNPVEWVKKPVGCALREAFIADPAVVTRTTTTIKSSVTSSGAGPIITTLGEPVDALGSGSGCSGISFDLPIGGQSFSGQILNACSGPMATAARISSALIGLSAILGGGLALLRLAGAGFGYNVKVSDGD